MPIPQWSVIIPAYNEEQRLLRTLLTLLEKWGEQGNYEIIIVDDGSKDDTAAVATMATHHLHVDIKVIRHKRNRGKGAAVRTGVAAAQGEWILLTDADGAVSIDNLDQFIPLTEKFPIVIGSKYRLPHYPRSVARTILAKTCNWFIRTLFELPYTDTQCGFKVIKGSVAHHLFNQMHINRWAYDIELLVLAKHFGIAVTEVPVDWKEDGNTRVKAFSAGITSMRDVLRIKLRLLSRRYKATSVHESTI